MNNANSQTFPISQQERQNEGGLANWLTLELESTQLNYLPQPRRFRYLRWRSKMQLFPAVTDNGTVDHHGQIR